MNQIVSIREAQIPSNITRSVSLIALTEDSECTDQFMTGLQSFGQFPMPNIALAAIVFDPKAKEGFRNPTSVKVITRALEADSMGVWIDSNDLLSPAANEVWSLCLERLHRFHVPRDKRGRHIHITFSAQAVKIWDNRPEGSLLHELWTISLRRDRSVILGEVGSNRKGANSLGRFCSIGLQIRGNETPCVTSEEAM